MPFISKPERKVSREAQYPTPLKKSAIGSDLRYPTRTNGSLVTRRSGKPQPPSLTAPTPEQPGSIDWGASLLFGGSAQLISMLESIVAGQGDTAERRWIDFCIRYREWERQYLGGKLLIPPTLNQVCHSFKIRHEDFWLFLSASVQSLYSKLGQLKASLVSSQVIEFSISAAADLEKGGKDRELLLKLAGLLSDKSGVQVNVNQQVSMPTLGDRTRLSTPLLQFSDALRAIDDDARSLEAIDADFVDIDPIKEGQEPEQEHE